MLKKSRRKSNPLKDVDYRGISSTANNYSGYDGRSKNMRRLGLKRSMMGK